jgi:hypothetical protein
MNTPAKISLAAAALFCALATGNTPSSAAPGDNRPGFDPTWNNNRAGFNTTVRGAINRFGGNRAENFGAFELLAESGETLRVLIGQDARFVTGLSNFRNNARVEIEGLRDGDAFLAREVRFEENGRFVTILTGTVQEAPRNNRFTLTLDSLTMGARTTTRTITVVDRNQNTQLFRSLRRGDQIEVHGSWWQGAGRWTASSLFEAEKINNLNGSNTTSNSDDYLDGRFATVRGRANVSSEDTGFILNLDNGQTLSVRSDTAVRVRRNDLVEVQGRYNSTTQVFRATSVRILDDALGTTETGIGNVNFAATVVTVNTATSLTVRGSNNRVYTVRSDTAFSRNISPGDRVRVIGTLDANGIVRADRVTLESNFASNDVVDFSGIVTETPFVLVRDYYTVRAANGRDYRVKYDGTASIRKNDNVRVRGRMDNDVVIADSMTRY